MSEMKPVAFAEMESWFSMLHQSPKKRPVKFCKYGIFPVPKWLSGFNIFKDH